MPVNKKHDEFYTLDMNGGWEVPVGYPAGIQQKISPVDWMKKTGAGRARGCCASRLASIQPRRSLTNIGKRSISSQAI